MLLFALYAFCEGGYWEFGGGGMGGGGGGGGFSEVVGLWGG